MQGLCIKQTQTNVSNALETQTKDESSHTTDSLPLPPFQHTLQLPTQSIPHPPLPRPLSTQFLHPTARYHHEAYSSQ